LLIDWLLIARYIFNHLARLHLKEGEQVEGERDREVERERANEKGVERGRMGTRDSERWS